MKSLSNIRNLFLPLILIVLAVAGTSFVCGSSHDDLVYVDVNRLLEGYERTKVEREAFNKKTNSLKAEADSLIMGWQSELKAFEKERSAMTKKEQELKQQLLVNKQQQLNNYQQAIQKKIREDDQKMTQTVINDINDYVKQFGNENGYRLIFGAQGSGNIMFASEASDLTEKILEGLNKQYNGS